jgi:hypothetical protein
VVFIHGCHHGGCRQATNIRKLNSCTTVQAGTLIHTRYIHCVILSTGAILCDQHICTIHSSGLRTNRWQCVAHKNEDRLLRRQRNALANHVYKLPNTEICWHQVPASQTKHPYGHLMQCACKCRSDTHDGVQLQLCHCQALLHPWVPAIRTARACGSCCTN